MKILTNAEFFGLFKLEENQGHYIQKYLFEDSSATAGFSLIKNYPVGGKFYPTKNNQGVDDDVVLVKVYIDKYIKDKNQIAIGLLVSKVSKFELETTSFGVISDVDRNSPTFPNENSSIASKKSSQPIDLEDNKRFVFDFNSNTFLDLKRKKDVHGVNIIQFIYNEHIATFNHIRGKILKIKVWINEQVKTACCWMGNRILNTEKAFRITRGETRDFTGLFFSMRLWVSPNPLTKKDIALEINSALDPSVIPERGSFTQLKLDPVYYIPITAIVIFLFWLNYNCKFLETNICFGYLYKVGTFFIMNGENVIFSTAVVTFVLLFTNNIGYISRLILKRMLDGAIKICFFVYRKSLFRKFKI